MTIKQHGGIFGRNPTFNNVTVDGTLTVDQIVEKTGAAGITLDGVTLKDGNVVLANGKGIDFSATSGTGTSELFDDYEEGTWTPVIADAITGGNTGSSPDPAGFYTKVGRLVTVLVRLINIDNSGMTAGNTLYIRGLPFAATSTGNGHLYTGAVRTADVTLTGHTLVAEIGASGADYIRFSESQNGAAATFLTVGDLALYQSDIFFSLTYAV